MASGKSLNHHGDESRNRGRQIPNSQLGFGLQPKNERNMNTSSSVMSRGFGIRQAVSHAEVMSNSNAARSIDIIISVALPKSGIIMHDEMMVNQDFMNSRITSSEFRSTASQTILLKLLFNSNDLKDFIVSANNQVFAVPRFDHLLSALWDAFHVPVGQRNQIASKSLVGDIGRFANARMVDAEFIPSAWVFQCLHLSDVARQNQIQGSDHAQNSLNSIIAHAAKKSKELDEKDSYIYTFNDIVHYISTIKTASMEEFYSNDVWSELYQMYSYAIDKGSERAASIYKLVQELSPKDSLDDLNDIINISIYGTKRMVSSWIEHFSIVGIKTAASLSYGCSLYIYREMKDFKSNDALCSQTHLKPCIACAAFLAGSVRKPKEYKVSYKRNDKLAHKLSDGGFQQFKNECVKLSPYVECLSLIFCNFGESSLSTLVQSGSNFKLHKPNPSSIVLDTYGFIRGEIADRISSNAGTNLLSIETSITTHHPQTMTMRSASRSINFDDIIDIIKSAIVKRLMTFVAAGVLSINFSIGGRLFTVKLPITSISSLIVDSVISNNWNSVPAIVFNSTLPHSWLRWMTSIISVRMRIDCITEVSEVNIVTFITRQALAIAIYNSFKSQYGYKLAIMNSEGWVGIQLPATLVNGNKIVNMIEHYSLLQLSAVIINSFQSLLNTDDGILNIPILQFPIDRKIDGVTTDAEYISKHVKTAKILPIDRVNELSATFLTSFFTTFMNMIGESFPTLVARQTQLSVSMVLPFGFREFPNIPITFPKGRDMMHTSGSGNWILQKTHSMIGKDIGVIDAENSFTPTQYKDLQILFPTSARSTVGASQMSSTASVEKGKVGKNDLDTLIDMMIGTSMPKFENLQSTIDSAGLKELADPFEMSFINQVRENSPLDQLRTGIMLLFTMGSQNVATSLRSNLRTYSSAVAHIPPTINDLDTFFTVEIIEHCKRSEFNECIDVSYINRCLAAHTGSNSKLTMHLHSSQYRGKTIYEITQAMMERDSTVDSPIHKLYSKMMQAAMKRGGQELNQSEVRASTVKVKYEDAFPRLK